MKIRVRYTIEGTLSFEGSKRSALEEVKSRGTGKYRFGYADVTAGDWSVEWEPIPRTAKAVEIRSKKKHREAKP